MLASMFLEISLLILDRSLDLLTEIMKSVFKHLNYSFFLSYKFYLEIENNK